MTTLRVFTIGGLLSYRALFSWLHPGLFVLVLFVPSVTQILFFTYLGRTAGVADDAFYVIGNAVVASAVPCLFGMAQTISDERYTQTLPSLIVSPASRIAVFLGRASPTVAHGAVVSACALIAGSVLLDVHIPAAALLPLALTILVTAFACTGLGMFNAALGLRWRESAVLSNVILYFLLLFAGVNVPLDLLPNWLASAAHWLPVTHGIEAARRLVDGATLADVAGLLGREALVGAAYTALGLAMIKRFEVIARRQGTLEVA